MESFEKDINKGDFPAYVFIEPNRNPADQFDFDLLGIRVPAMVASPYAKKGAVVGQLPQDYYDHTSILATLEKRYGLAPLTQRDAAAQVRTLAIALNLQEPRLLPEEAPLQLPMPLADGLITRFMALFRRATLDTAAPMSEKQHIQLTLAHACNLQMLDQPAKENARRQYLAVRSQDDAAKYIQEVENRVRSRRRPPI